MVWNWAEWVILLYLFGHVVGWGVACYFGVGRSVGKTVRERWVEWGVTVMYYAIVASVLGAAGLWR